MLSKGPGPIPNGEFLPHRNERRRCFFWRYKPERCLKDPALLCVDRDWVVSLVLFSNLARTPASYLASTAQVPGWACWPRCNLLGQLSEWMLPDRRRVHHPQAMSLPRPTTRTLRVTYLYFGTHFKCCIKKRHLNFDTWFAEQLVKYGDPRSQSFCEGCRGTGFSFFTGLR